VYVGYNTRVLAVPFVIVRETPVRWRAVVIAVTASAWLLAAAVTVHAGGGSDDPDALYAQRENLESALRAADIWSAQLVRSPEDFEVACKVARARHWLGEVLPRDQRASHLEQGIAAAQRAIALAPDRPDGHFWLGANMGAYAGVSLMRAFRYRTAIRQAFEAALARDPAFARGGAYCALGKYFNMVPAMFGGNKRRSEELLQRCLSFDPQSVVGRYYLGQTLVALDRPEDARQASRPDSRTMRRRLRARCRSGSAVHRTCFAGRRRFEVTTRPRHDRGPVVRAEDYCPTARRGSTVRSGGTCRTCGDRRARVAPSRESSDR
jgi:tetratricopeptide (TPR) repeat protein